MIDATVSSRMPAAKKAQAQKILERAGTNSSQVINALFDRIVQEGNVHFLMSEPEENDKQKREHLARAFEIVDSIPISRKSEFDNMSETEIRMRRLKDRGLL